MFRQSQEDGAIGILKCIADPGASSGDFFGPGSGKMAGKGPVIKFNIEQSSNTDKNKDLLWSKSCEAIGEDFVI